MDKQIEIIREKLSTEELLCQLAEECAELSQAALKLRRAIQKENPTPVSINDAGEHLIEEIADVRLVVKVLEYDTFDLVYQNIMRHKLKRWVRRLEGNDAEVH